MFFFLEHPELQSTSCGRTPGWLAGTETIASRRHPGAAHHQPELQRPTQVVLDAGIFRQASQQYSVHFYFCTFLFGHSGRQVHPVHVYSVHVYYVYFYSMHFYYVCVVFCVKPPLAKTLGVMLRFEVPSSCCLHHKVRRRLAYRETEFDALSERAEERRISSAA